MVSQAIRIMIKMPNLSQEPPASSKAPDEDLKEMDVLCTFKILAPYLDFRGTKNIHVLLVLIWALDDA